MIETEPFRITRRAVSESSEIEIADAPPKLAAPSNWLVEKLGVQTLFVGNRYSDGAMAGFVLTNWPLTLLERSVRERWYVRDVIASTARDYLGWTRPSDWRELMRHNPLLAQRMDVRAEHGLPLPWAFRFAARGVTGLVTVTREEPLTRTEEQVIEFFGPGLFNAFLDEVRVRVTAGVTVRERECLVLTAKGFTAGDIAEKLGLSEHTVNAHMRNVSTKLGTANRAHAIAEALRLGLIGYGHEDERFLL